MDLSKMEGFFNPENIKENIHIIGCGSIGSVLAELLIRTGIEGVKIHLYDFDIVEPHNMTNQLFFQEDIGHLKVEAVRNNILRINPNLEKCVVIHPKGWNGEALDGHVFLCVDSIEVRKEIAKGNLYNPRIKFMCDFRTRLTDAQHYAADWSNKEQKEDFIASMNFTEEEAKEATPMSACGTTLSVAPTIRDIVCKGVANWMNFILDKERLKKLILVDAFAFAVDAF